MVHFAFSRPAFSLWAGESEAWTIVLLCGILSGRGAKLVLSAFALGKVLERLTFFCLSFLFNIVKVSVIARSASSTQKRYSSGGIAHHRIPDVRLFSHDQSPQIAAK